MIVDLDGEMDKVGGGVGDGVLVIAECVQTNPGTGFPRLRRMLHDTTSHPSLGISANRLRSLQSLLARCLLRRHIFKHNGVDDVHTYP